MNLLVALLPMGQSYSLCSVGKDTDIIRFGTKYNESPNMRIVFAIYCTAGKMYMFGSNHGFWQVIEGISKWMQSLMAPRWPLLRQLMTSGLIIRQLRYDGRAKEMEGMAIRTDSEWRTTVAGILLYVSGVVGSISRYTYTVTILCRYKLSD